MPQEFNSLFGFMQFLKQKLRPKAHYSLEGIATGGIIIRLICHLIARDGGITGFN